jgi:hypothetical protein
MLAPRDPTTPARSPRSGLRPPGRRT